MKGDSGRLEFLQIHTHPPSPPKADEIQIQLSPMNFFKVFAAQYL